MAINISPGFPNIAPNAADARFDDSTPDTSCPVAKSMSPEARMDTAVSVHTTIVSANTSKIPHIPCRTGSATFELEWTITEEPSPASFENTPRFIPRITACLMPKPTIPPPTAFMPNALLKIDVKIAGTVPMCVTKMTTAPTMYKTTISGTIFSVTAAIRFRPPNTTIPTAAMIKSPVTQVGIPNAEFILLEMELTCVILPIPKEARKQKTENAPARKIPIALQFFFSPKPYRR